MADSLPALDALVAAVRASAKYRHIAEDVLRALGARELASRRNLKEAIKATKNKLHQVGAAYLPDKMLYTTWLDELRAASCAPSADPGALRAVCQRIMAQHASTRERLPILSELYATTLADLPPIRSVLDVACGLNPLAIPWMPLAPEATYCACDMYLDMAAFLQEAMPLLGVRGLATAGDVLHALPTPPVDLALLLKAIPCLEQADKAAAARLLDILPAPHLLVSFPAHSLGGHDVHMLAHYDAHFRALVAGRPWAIRRFVFETELVFRVDKGT